jgi:hypothetical protein
MKRIITLTALVTLKSAFWGYDIDVVKAQGSCQPTVDNVAKEIRQKGTSVRILVYPPSNKEQLTNSRRIDTIIFVLATKATMSEYKKYVDIATNILYSKVLMKSYATRVFSSCGATGYVDFLMHKTDWRESFMMTDDGKLGFKRCADSPSQISHSTARISGVSSGLDGYCAYVVPDF